MGQIIVQETPITVVSEMGNDYICLTDMAGAKSDEVRAADVIKNWLRNRYTIEFLGTWEQIHNPNFNVVEFDHFRMDGDGDKVDGVYGDSVTLLNDGRWKCIRGSYVTYVD